MRELAGSLVPLAIVLAVPIIPLLLWGEFFGAQLSAWQASPPGRAALAAAIVAILASDILLPVPSGPVSTLAGAQLGAGLGLLAAWLGMTIGAVVAFALARRWGRPLAVRFAKPEDLDRLAAKANTHDAWLMLATRPLPVLAEACVLLLGLLRTPWRRFLPVLAFSNLAIAATYAFLGDYAAQREWLSIAVCLSLAVPVLLAAWARRHWRTRR